MQPQRIIIEKLYFNKLNVTWLLLLFVEQPPIIINFVIALTAFNAWKETKSEKTAEGSF